MRDFELDVAEVEEPAQQEVESAPAATSSWPYSCSSTSARSCVAPVYGWAGFDGV